MTREEKYEKIKDRKIPIRRPQTDAAEQTSTKTEKKTPKPKKIDIKG